jgi:protein-S-isoprenylcysteine O-methyltransferase Ste14
VSAAFADILVVAAWVVVAVADVAALAREREARRRLGPPLAGGGRAPRAVIALLIAVAGGGFVLLEGRTERLPFQPIAAWAGLALGAAGMLLHVSARRTLGPLWSGVITVRAGQWIVERGPYRVVRHPIYASFFLLAAGSLLVHPSVAVACAAFGCVVGLALKIAFEERALRRTLGEPYRRYAERVPALVPRLRGRRRDPSGTDCPGG